MKKLKIYKLIDDHSGHMVRTSASALTLYVLAKSVSTLFNCFNCNAYVAE